MPLLTPDLIAFHQTLVAPDPSWGSLGARELPPDGRDIPALRHPGIALAAAAPPPSASLLNLIREPRLNQGAEGSCVAFSTCGHCQMVRSVNGGTWPDYAGHQLYAEAGGQGNSGVDVRTTLGICIAKGTPLLNGTRDPVIKSYVFADATPGAFRTQIKAAIAAGFSVLIASLLPIPFGWNSGTVLSSGYHEYLGVGYHMDAQGIEWCVVENTWGDSWPGDAPAGTPPGVGRIRFDTLEQDGLQHGYSYAVVPTDLMITPVPPPPPPPPSGRAMTGTIKGQGMEGLNPGDTLAATSGVFTGTVDLRTIEGGGPPPVGDLKVILTRGRGGWMYATVTDAQTGEYLSSTCHLTLNGVEMGISNSTKSGDTEVQARWYLGAKTGTVVVNASAAGERSGSATLTV